MSRDLPTPIKLENGSNLRDLGGWEAAGGKRVRTGIVYRASALMGLSDADLVTVSGLGIRTVCDLRGVRESPARPVSIAGARHEHLPIEASVGASLRDIARTGIATGHTTADEMLDVLRDAYQAYALQCFAQYRAIFARLLDDEAVPLMFHCAAGKDRTGFGAALILTALGVGWDDVLADYMATNRLWRREGIVLESSTPGMETLLSAHASLLTASFAAINGAYGSVDAYLDQAIGLNAQRLALLRDRLTA